MLFGLIPDRSKKRTSRNRRNTQVLVSRQINQMFLKQTEVHQSSITDELRLFEQRFYREHATDSVDQMRERFVRKHDGDLPTQPALVAVKPQTAKQPAYKSQMPYFTIEPPLPIDKYGCAYLGSLDKTTETSTLISTLVQEFCSYMGFYPAIIYLSPQRWVFCEQLECFRISRDATIPYALGHENFDVCVKSLPLQR